VERPRPELPGMADYGVGGPGWEPLPWAWAAERLLTGRCYWVVTVSADGRPHALPVWGVWDDDELRFAFSCGPSARKARELRANPKASVMPEDTVECVSLEGSAALLDDGERRERWIEAYLAKYLPVYPDLSADFLRQHLLFEFVPERGYGVIDREDEFATRATRWAFPQR